MSKANWMDFEIQRKTQSQMRRFEKPDRRWVHFGIKMSANLLCFGNAL